MDRILFNKAHNHPVLLLVTVLGRVPVWVLLLAVAGGMLHQYAFACLYSVLLICRAYLAWYENGSSGPKLLIGTLWKNCFRWVLWSVLLEMVLFGLLYALFFGSRFDDALLLTALGLSIPAMVIGILMPPKPASIRHTYFYRTLLMRTAVVLLWLYIVLTGEMALFKLMALAVIYTLEFFSIYEPEACRSAEEGASS